MTLIDRPTLMTTEELEALPDDGVERWLINGELREGGDVPKRNRGHSRTEAKFCGHLCTWSDSQPEPRGEVLVGDAGVRLRRNPDSTVGTDVAYISAETVANNPRDERIIDGVPLLVIEVLSPSDKQQDIEEKVQTYLDNGVPLIWFANVRFKTVLVYRPDAEPELFNINDILSGDPHLPGLRIALVDIFGR